MDERVIQFRVGAMVLATTLIAGILVLLVEGREILDRIPGLGASTYTIYITFDNAPVERDTPVRKAGFLIGRVTNVKLDSKDRVLVTAAIKREYSLKKNEVCRVTGSLLGGDNSLEFVKVQDTNQPAPPLKEGDIVQGVAPNDPLRAMTNLEGNLAQAIDAVARTSEQIGTVAERLNKLLDNNDEQINRIVSKTEITLDRIRSAAESTDEVLSDPVMKENLKRSLAELPKVLEETRQAVGGMQRTLSLADRNLQNIEGVTKPLGERGEKLIDNIDRATGRLDQVLSELSTFSATLNDSQGSVSQLLNNPDLYQRLNAAATNVEQITNDLKPIVADARVFTDKIARHPEVLGVRGAIKPSSGIK